MWLFALASGVNACLVEAHVSHSHVATAGDSATAHASAMLPGHVAVAGHDYDSYTAEAPNLKVCDDGSQSLAKQDLTVAQTDPGPAPIVAVLWSAAPIGSALRRMDAMQPAAPGLPIRVRYSRLTL